MKLSKIATIAFAILLSFTLVFTTCDGDGTDNNDKDKGKGNGDNVKDSEATKKPSNISSNFLADSSTGFHIQWHNDPDVTTQTLQIVLETASFTDNSVKNITVTGTSFSSEAGDKGSNGNYAARYIFRTEVTGLTPGTEYKYRIGSKSSDLWSDEFKHTTSGAANKDFSFTVITDPQDSASGAHKSMKNAMEAAVSYDSNTRFFLVAGDIVDQIGRRPQEIVNYTNVISEFTKNGRPTAATQGNHDTYDAWAANPNQDEYRFNTKPGSNSTPGTIYNAFVSFPRNGHLTDEDKALSYYFYYNDVLVISLNSMVCDTVAGHKAQADWLKDLLEDNKTGNKSKYIIVFTHVGPFAGRGIDRYYAYTTRQAYGKIFDDYDVDIVFSGHDHIYTRSAPFKLTNYFSQISADPKKYNSANFNFSATNGTVYSIVSTTGPKFYGIDGGSSSSTQAQKDAALDPNTGVPYVYPKHTPTAAEQQPGIYVNVKVTAANLTVNAMRVGSTTPIDTYTVTAKR